MAFGSSPGTVQAGQRIHLTITLDYTSNLISLYANGIFLNSGSAASWGAGTVSSNTFSTGVTIGSNTASAASTSEAFNGLIDEVRVYNTAMGAGEVQSTYAAQVPESSSVALAAFASLGMLVRRRRR